MPENVKDNIVTFGLKNAHYATYEVGVNGEITYDEPIPMPGSVEIAFDPVGDMIEFYADDMLYYSAPNNQGYEGKLTIAKILNTFTKDCLGEVEDATSTTQYEDADAKPKPFALLFEFDGDVKAVRHAMFNCKVSRPSLSSKSKTKSVDPNTTELSFTATPIILPIDGKKKRIVKHKTVPTTSEEVYESWYEKVILPGVGLVTGDTAATGQAGETGEPEVEGA